MKYKIGDKVRVRDDLVVGKCYGSLCFSSNSQEYKGKIFTIGSLESELYMLDGTDDWYWSEEMLEPVDKEVDKDIYDFIIEKEQSKTSIIWKFALIKDYLIDVIGGETGVSNDDNDDKKMIKFCEAVKAYPNIKPKQDQLYYVKIVDNGKYSFYLRKHKDFKHLSTGLLDDAVSYQYKYQFTRKEVEEISKKEGKDYTPFMIKVEDNE